MIGYCQPCRDGWLLSAKDDQGRTGWGDACTLPGQPAPNPESLRRAGAQMVGRPVVDILDEGIELPPAIEAALLDLRAQELGVPLRRLLAAEAVDEVAVNAVAEDSGSMETAQDQGFQVVKVKLGGRPVLDELDRLKSLPLRSGTLLRLDANRAWSRDEAVTFIAGAVGLPIDSLEEPLAEPDLVAYGQIQGYCPFALALDESLAVLDWQRLVEHPPVKRLVVKPGLLGGLRKSLQLIRQAKSRGLDSVVTSMVDSAIGVAAAAHLAAASGMAHLAHGLSTGDWLGADVASPLPIHKGRLSFDLRPGLGVTPR